MDPNSKVAILVHYLKITIFPKYLIHVVGYDPLGYMK